MEPLSSFAISIAAGIVLEIYPNINKFRTQGVDKQIKLAFNKALKDWSVNESVREQKERELKSLLQSHIKAGDMITLQVVNQETFAFIKYFEKRLVEHTQAYDYLRLIIDQKKHDETVASFSRIEDKLSGIETLIKEGGIDPRDIGDWLNRLPFGSGEETVKEAIEQWYSQRDIKEKEKALLLLATKKIFERTEELSQEIKELQSRGNTYLAEVLEKIKEAVEQRRPDALTAIYEAYNKKEKEDRITLLLELIESSKAIFAYEEATQFYKDLIELNPSYEVYFNFGYFLQEFNFIEESIQQYEKVLAILRDLATENPRTYLPKVATTLNNLAILHKDRNEFELALSEYEESLMILRDLATENPQTYLPDVSQALNNLAILHKARNEFLLALSEYEESLAIRRDLATENPRTYLPKVASTLNNLAILHSVRNEFELALPEYEESLAIRRDLATDNPRTYLPDVAQTLNNLANLHEDKNEFSLALSEYEESLAIRRDLATENSRRYLPDVAQTLNNLTILYKNMGEIPLAVEKYEESHTLYKELAKESPQVYEIEYAKTLLIGVYLSKKNIQNLKEARELLLKYPDIPQAQNLLQIIDDFEKE
ncbi:tetratricopeptide repeat protein [Dokdonia sp.]|uniref:tetratricopeptide repeat protein n=1 Tax=Dokdonia sp. TaxID=2024995 RepID=UPI003263EDE8